MKSVVNSKKQEQFKKFMAKDTFFLKKIVGGEDAQTKPAKEDDQTKVKI